MGIKPGAVLTAAAVAVLLAPFLRAPRARQVDEGATPSIDTAVQTLQLSGLTGWDLVDEAIEVVNDRFQDYSIWHLWEGAELSFRHRRGFSDQYNLALGHILDQLGFQVRLVHAARVRELPDPDRLAAPWWHAGRSWLRVSHEGQVLDVSAGQRGLTAGELSFVPVSEVREAHLWTPLLIRVAMVPLVSAVLWGGWLRGQGVPTWLYGRLHRAES